MSIKTTCLDITKAAGKLEDKEAMDLLLDVAQYVDAKMAAGETDMAEALLKQVKKLTTQEVEMTMIEKRNHLINLGVKNRIKDYLKNFSDPATGIKAYMGGTVKKVKGALNSIDARGKAVVNEHMGKMINDLEKGKLLDLFNSDALEKEIAAEMWEIREGGNPGISGSPQAKDIATILHKYQMSIIERQNKLGAWIKEAPSYLTRQSHNSLKIRKAGYETWKNAILPLLDSEKTFGPGVDVDEFLQGAYEGLISGLHKRVTAEQDNDFAGYSLGFHGPGSLAKKLSQQRILHFKDANSWLSYNSQFGSHNLRESIISGLEHGGRSIALMEGFGTNPLHMFDQVMHDLKMENRLDTKKYDALSKSYIENLFKELEGTTRIPGNINVARISAGVRAINNMSKLGAAVISSISDIPFQAAELRFHGHNVFSAYGQVFTNLFRGRGNTEQRELARMIGVGLEGMLGDMLSRFTVQDSVPGLMSKIQQRFFKLNAMSWWNDSHKTGIGLIMSNHLAEQSHKTFNQLDESMRNVLSLYGIGDGEWNAFRTTVHTQNGYRYLTPDRIENEALATTWRTFFIDRADFAVPHPGAAERAMMNMGTRPGTMLGEAIRFFMQFKSFPLSAMRKGMGRELYGGGANTIVESLLKGKGDLLGMAHLIAATTLFGYGAMAMRDTIKGREPRDPFSPQTIMAAMAQGGGMGIYGDFMFGEFSRYGRSFLATLSGPTIGQFDDLAEVYTRIRNGDDPTAQMLRSTINNTPFVNLFYTRAALDYLILYQLQEMVNPGFLHRMEARIQRENDQQFYLPPSQYISRGGGGGLFEALR
jgi:hypothetical protein